MLSSTAGVIKARPVRTRPCPVFDYDFTSWGFLDCGTVGTGGLPSDGNMMLVMCRERVMIFNRVHGT